MTTESILRAGAGQADITPEKGIQIAGDIGRYRPVEEVRDPLYAKALILEGGGKKACILSLDVTGIIRKWAVKLRRQIAEVIGTDPDAVISHCMQSHSVPFVGNHMISDDCPLVPKELSWLRGGDDRYIEPFFAGVMKAVRQANETLQSVKVKAGRGMDGRVAHNRRFIMRDGTVRTHPRACDPNILHCEGPIDPEVGVALFVDKEDSPVATLLHHTCHPVHGYPHRWISADWPSSWAEGVRQLLGGTDISLVLNGACGNIHHCNHLDPTQEDSIEVMGDKLTETAGRALKCLVTIENPVLRWASRTIKIPMRKLTKKEISSARKLIEDHPLPMWRDREKTAVEWDWMYAVSTLDFVQQRRKQSWYDCEIQALRVGDLAVVAWPGEPFVEAQLEVKKDSPLPFTFVAHFCNDSAGYIPTREAFERGGYETRTANWSKLGPEALETITAETKTLLTQLAAGLAGRTAPLKRI